MRPHWQTFLKQSRWKGRFGRQRFIFNTLTLSEFNIERTMSAIYIFSVVPLIKLFYYFKAIDNGADSFPWKVKVNRFMISHKVVYIMIQ